MDSLNKENDNKAYVPTEDDLYVLNNWDEITSPSPKRDENIFMRSIVIHFIENGQSQYLHGLSKEAVERIHEEELEILSDKKFKELFKKLISLYFKFGSGIVLDYIKIAFPHSKYFLEPPLYPFLVKIGFDEDVINFIMLSKINWVKETRDNMISSIKENGRLKISEKEKNDICYLAKEFINVEPKSDNNVTTIELRKLTEYPGARYIKLGPFSGEWFRDEYVYPAMIKGTELHLDMTGVAGFGSGWLEEVFGGLVRKGIDPLVVSNLIKEGKWDLEEDQSRALSFVPSYPDC